MLKKKLKKIIKSSTTFHCTPMIVDEENVKINKVKKSFRSNDNNKKEKVYMKYAKKRKEKGLIILPRNVETKIYKLRKKLQQKNVDPEEIKQIIRKKRRFEENRFRNDNKRVCFKCRKPGHLVSECTTLDSNDPPANICYFCGSLEHRLHECSKYLKKKKQMSSNDGSELNLPYATCFICKQNGHLTRNCSMNKNGAFPHGGKCRGCGSINHTIKECPKQKTEEKESELLLTTVDNLDGGVDIDEYSLQNPNKNSEVKKKIVKF